MVNPSSSKSAHASQDAELWQSLKSAITASSGFQRWRSEQAASIRESSSVDQLIRLYLRETLETLAY